jgi:hypothetical protein
MSKKSDFDGYNPNPIVGSYFDPKNKKFLRRPLFGIFKSKTISDRMQSL